MVFSYPGAIHIHSVHSDGTGTIEEIVRAAKKAGLSWIVITDHNKMDVKEGFYDGVCVIVGEEISPADGNHYLALGIKTPVSCDIAPAEYIQQVKEQGGFGFIAHPDGNVFRKNTHKPLRWEDWDIKDFGGIEIWNYMSNWVDSYNDKSAFNAVHGFLFRNNVLSGPTKNILDWWDNLNNETQEIIPAIGGVDAHSFNIKWKFAKVKIFSYKSSLCALTNFIHLDNPLPDDFENRKKVILKAIKSGKNIIMNRRGKKSKNNPIFYIQNSDRKVYPGDFIELDDCSKMFVELPLKADIKLIHNGKVILQKKTKNLEIDYIDRGKYRIEAYYKNQPWIFSNPILVK